MPENPFDIDGLFVGSLERLRAEAKYFSRLTDHNPELGRMNESHLVKLLRDYLPPKIGIGTGFIASGGRRPQQSPQCDIILYDALNNAPLYKSDAWSIYPIEIVYGVIEVKTTLNKAELDDAFDKCSKIRAMAKADNGMGNKAYIEKVSPRGRKALVRYRKYKTRLSPRFFIFGYSGWKKSAALEKNFKIVSENNPKAHVHGICNLHAHGSLYVNHRAHRKGEERFSNVSEGGFRVFLMNLPASLNSMVPKERFGIGFDLVDLEHYALALDSPSLA